MFLDYLPFLLNLGLELYSAWRTNPERPRTRLLDWTRRGTPPPAPPTVKTNAADVAGEILRNLPPGASAYYEAPDGTRLLVWSTVPLPGTRGEGDGYQLW
ncbi:hypothetical protein [Streptomyces erythrochromogenes]|uniref:hypothetical protein n=1 Tax=Streptomyces erythrochromogenes TaxID=285574 RepID=UPI00386ABA62|nr:hypothetical protein OG364_00650 [Streptomyces erythrochromogenes]WST98415.1 hypothetical protein OG364_40885 [Streptomyces erythrochromogenes]